MFAYFICMERDYLLLHAQTLTLVRFVSIYKRPGDHWSLYDTGKYPRAVGYPIWNMKVCTLISKQWFSQESTQVRKKPQTDRVRMSSKTVHFSRSGKSRKMVRDQYQVMGLVIPPKTYPHRPNLYSHCHVYSSLTRSGLGTKLASFPGLPRLRFLIACSMQKLSQKAWWILPRDPCHGWRHRF